MENKLVIKKNIKILKRIVDSASFALLLSIGFFAYEMSTGAQETKEIVDNLTNIQSSLSTRYLGLFPEYIGNINRLLDDAIKQQGDSDNGSKVIICEDVLYYGIRSDANGFRKMMKNIATLANSGSDVTIAYYDADGHPFKSMIRSSLISNQCQMLYRQDLISYHKKLRIVEKNLDSLSRYTGQEKDILIGKLIDQQFDGYRAKHQNVPVPALFGILSNRKMVDSVLCERYFKQTLVHNSSQFISNVNELRMPLPIDEYANDSISIQVNNLCTKLDSIKQTYLNKPNEQIGYGDIYGMYRDITYAIEDFFSQYSNIKLIPLNEHLTMSCWLTIVNGQDTAIIAFPSKYSTDEIGFISQDVAFSKYIQTMLNGMRISNDIQ